jgi:hypothetical protein
MRKRYLIIVSVTAVVALSSCATVPRNHAGGQVACSDPLYLQLKATQPDSLSEREYARLTALESACQAERAATAREHHGSGMMGGVRWYWMPAMMLFAAGMALMMGWR